MSIQMNLCSKINRSHKKIVSSRSTPLLYVALQARHSFFSCSCDDFFFMRKMMKRKKERERERERSLVIKRN
jgi:hypothetical protein